MILLSLTALLLIAVFAVIIGRLLEKIEKLSARVARLEQRLPVPEAPAPPEKVVIPPSPLFAKATSSAEPRLLSTPPPLPIASPPPPPLPATPFNWEAFMGVRLFAWLGGFALFLGVVFLVKYSFENNLISPLGRVTIGLAVAAFLVGAGWWLARGKYRATAQSLCATGIVILYADLFAAHSFYGLISLTTAFFAMSAVTLFSFLLAVNLSAQVVVILGLLGGFLTPLLLRSGVDNAPSLFLYIALLDLGVAAVALRKGWLYLVLLAAIGTVLTQAGWAGEFFSASKGGRAFWIFLGFEALFGAIYFAERFGRRFALRSAGPGAVAEGISVSDAASLASQSEASTMTAAAVAGFAALGFGFWFLAIPSLARQPLFFFSFIFVADAGVLALAVVGRARRSLAFGAGAFTFALIAGWIALFAPHASLSSSLAAIVIFALLHAATTPASAWRPALLPFTAGGTITPFLLLVILIERVALWNPTPVLAVALVLCGILLAAAIVRRADWLALAALLGSGLTEFTWQSERFSSEQAIPALVCYGLFLLLFVAFPFCSAQKEKTWSWAISALAQVLQFWLVYRAVTLALPNEWMGLLPAIFILPGAIGVWSLLKLYRADPATGDSRLAWQGGALLLFVSLIFPLQFDREWITLGWALEGVALLWLFGRLPHRGLRVVAVVPLAAAFARLALNPAVFDYHRRAGVRILNWYLYVYGITSFCLLAGARIFGNPRLTTGERVAPAVFLLLNLEIADYFSIGPTLTFSFSGNFARDMTYSILWALFALGLIIAGMRIRQKAARYAGVGLLGITLAKLFLHDLSDLNELYRIGAFVGVAVILIAASFIYQRFLSPAAQTK
ncbi:MAG: DUF2339 domain-containing protein [Chthoniobacterales bacterium]|nr:DUF2339 domain-containing protein [Chthoniobacterales bacterium]